MNPLLLPVETEIKLTKMVAVTKHEDMLQCDYTLIGHLILPITVGNPVRVARHTRNGVKMPGIFATSPVTLTVADHIYTQNSIWKIERVANEQAPI